MERVINKDDQKKKKINRAISYTILIVSIILLIFCAYQIVEYATLMDEKSKLTKNLEVLKQNTNYLRDNFGVLQQGDYKSVYVDTNFQYIDGLKDSVTVIK